MWNEEFIIFKRLELNADIKMGSKWAAKGRSCAGLEAKQVPNHSFTRLLNLQEKCSMDSGDAYTDNLVPL